MSTPDARPPGASQPGQPEPGESVQRGPLRAPIAPGPNDTQPWPQPPAMGRPGAGPSESQIATEPAMPAAVQAQIPAPDAGRPPVWRTPWERIRHTDRRRTYVIGGGAAALLVACLACSLLNADKLERAWASLTGQPYGITGPAGEYTPAPGSCDFATNAQDAARLYGGDPSRWQAVDTNGDGRPDGWHYIPGNATQINPEGCAMEGYVGNSNGSTTSFDSRSTQVIQGGTIWNSTDLDHLHQQNGYPER